jgi:hypothetical protein
MPPTMIPPPDSRPDLGPDRRRQRRARIAAVVIVCTDERYIGSYLVENLSAGGLLLLGDASLARGSPVRLLLCLAGGRRIALRAEVCRHERRGTQFACAVRFCDLADATRRLLDEIVLAQLSLPSLRAVAAAKR